MYRGTVFVILRNIVLAAAILIFARGFFPHKTVLPGLSEWSEDATDHPAGPFDKVIFMVVDALRSDFVYGNASEFKFTQNLIRSGAALPFTGHANPPTITMPRVKAITTGSVPSFLDLVLNFAESDTSSTLATQDSWLAQLRARPDGKLVMYGDDTWLRLFPDFFGRAEGTTSFFVSDFTEVDSNVTRHIPKELARNDWNGMILHFLGLDHIGHKTGPRGPNMPAKQKEMDGIVEQIYNSMESRPHLQSTLLVLLGDHGMNEAGNHGANSAGEVSTALTFISPKLKDSFPGRASPHAYADDFKYYDVVDQSDIAPTLAALLSFPVPKNSLGAIIPDFLTLWPEQRDQHNLLFHNAKQMQGVANGTYTDAFESISDLGQCTDKAGLSDKHKLACKWLAVREMHDTFSSGQYMFIRDNTPVIQSFLREAQDQLSGTASKYDETSMLIGVSLAILCCWPTRSSYDRQAGGSGFAIVCMFLTQILYSITMFASSYVEEEHQFWYWITSAWLVTFTIRQQRGKLAQGSGLWNGIVVCILFGIIRRWNQTGQKYAGEADLVTEVCRRNPWLLWVLIFLSYSVVPRHFRTRLAEIGLKQLAAFPVLVSASALLFKLAFTAADAPELLQNMGFFSPILGFASNYTLTNLARVVFVGLTILIALAAYIEQPWQGTKQFSAFLEDSHNVMSLLLITQTRTSNIPLILLFHAQVSILRHARPSGRLEALLTMVMLQYSSFFALGGTNAISSVDLSNAYNGIGGYNVVAVGGLTFVSNWIGPIWWGSATACILKDNMGKGQSTFEWFGVLTDFAAVHTTTVMVACFVLREHLFVWTVFSPKYLYMMAWTFAQHMVVNGLFSCLISVGG